MMSPVKYTDVKPGVAITPSVICRYFNVSSQELAAMNPAIRPVIIMHNKQLPPDLTLHLPATLPEDTVLAVLGSIPDSLKSVEPEQSHYYQVERGDNLSVIAVRLGVSVRDLIAENDLPANARIRAGQMLRVPGRAPAVVLSCASEKPRTAALKPVVDSIRPAIVEGESAAQQPAGDQGFDAALYDLDAAISPDGRSATIRVSVDETISHYSEWLAVPAAQIIKLNEIGPRATLRTGQKLRLPFAGPAAVDAFSTARLEYHMAIEEDFYMQFRVAGIRDHVIVSGENIWSICNTGENQIPEWLFRKYNKKTDLAALRSGDIVRFPVIVEKSAEDKAAAGDIIDNRNCWPGAVLPLRGCPRPVRILP
jgi:LysM repeat protein